MTTSNNSQDDDVANADDLDQMLSEPSADDLERMLDAEPSKPEVTDPSSADLDMMLASEEDDTIASIDDIQISDEDAPPPQAPRQVKKWFATILGQELGPFDFDALLEMVHDGELSKTDSVREQSQTEWVEAETIVGLFDGVKDQVIQSHSAVTGNVSPQRAITPLKSAKSQAALPVTNGDEEAEAIWYCRIDGKEVGPMPFETLQGIGEAGNLGPNDKVRFEGSGGWVPADSIGGLTVRSPEPPKPEPTPVAESPKPAAPSEPVAPPPAMAASAPMTPPPAPTPPPRPAYTPPPKPRAFTPPKPSKSSGSSMGNPFENMSFDPKIFAVIGVIGVLVAGYFFAPNLMGSGAGKYYEATEEINKKLVAAGENAASLKGELQPQLDAIKAELEERASSKRPALRALLDCYRYYFPKVFDGTAEEREAALKGINERLAAAKTYM